MCGVFRLRVVLEHRLPTNFDKQKRRKDRRRAKGIPGSAGSKVWERMTYQPWESRTLPWGK
jgi:hypothetical protein